MFNKIAISRPINKDQASTNSILPMAMSDLITSPAAKNFLLAEPSTFSLLQSYGGLIHTDLLFWETWLKGWLMGVLGVGRVDQNSAASKMIWFLTEWTRRKWFWKNFYLWIAKWIWWHREKWSARGYLYDYAYYFCCLIQTILYSFCQINLEVS